MTPNQGRHHTRTLTDYLLLVSRGLAMGAVDVVPGMSGGTIALITGIYEELIQSIRSFNLRLFSIIRKDGFLAAWETINGNFLVAVLSGVLISIFSLAKLFSWLLVNHPLLVWAFFFGLIIGSSIYVGSKIKRYNVRVILFFLTGASLAYYVTVTTPATTPESLWFIFLSGSIAFCALILPGLSGAFILILLGKYEFMLQALLAFNVPIVVVFCLGGVAGVLVFSHLIGWLLFRHPNATLALLTGFMVGSLNKLWPWKKVVESYVNSQEEVVPLIEKSISPMKYAEIYGLSPQLPAILVCALCGIILIAVLARLKKR